MPKFLKGERILKSSEFDVIYKSGRRHFSANFFMTWRPAGRKRLGITVSSKVGKANIRNRIKRVVREFFRLNKDIFPEGDCIITARSGAGSMEPAAIRGELNAIIRKGKG